MWRISVWLGTFSPGKFLRNGRSKPVALWFRVTPSCTYVIDSQPYESFRVIVYRCLPNSAPQGELITIDTNDKIYYLPCGDLCEDAEIPTDDDPVSYTYLGCYGDDNSDRIFSGNFLLQYAEMTTEVSRD